MKRSAVLCTSAIMGQFVDPSYLANKRPALPGGAWPVELLGRKSFADLQQLWFSLVKERNMLSSTKHHYTVHQEELGAMPAPTRIKMIHDSMENIRTVMRERDNEATDRALQIFKERMGKGVYRYPPGPPMPPGEVGVSVVRIKLSKKVSETRLKELFGMYDVFEFHRGIAKVQLRLSEEAWQAKEDAETDWEEYRAAVKRFEDYHRFDKVDSMFDHAAAELAPQVFQGCKPSAVAGEFEVVGEDLIRAVDVDVPTPAVSGSGPVESLKRLHWMNKPDHEKRAYNFTRFPLRTTAAPEAPPERPTHPDEIEGPWVAEITYDSGSGAAYARDLQIERIDGAEVLSFEEVPFDEPAARRDPVYQEAINMEEADISTQYQWPHLPLWDKSWEEKSKQKLDKVITHNYNNVVEYVDREVLLTGKSAWEMPIEIDYSCGEAGDIPPHAQKPESPFGRAHFRSF